jgi:formate hydrogenlyase subunit 3/multisubunit Na+/H+ antiporter MnhD subunit
MTLPPTIPIIFLVLGALAIGAGELARLRRPTLIMLIAVLLALAALLTMLNASLPITQIVAAWQPISVFTVPLSFRVDQTAWVLALGLLLTLTAAAFTWGSYPGQRRPAPRAVALLLTAAALAGFFASNLLTLAVAWGMLDLIFVAALLIRGGSEVGQRAALAIVVNTASTVCLWIAALSIENQAGSLYWHLISASEQSRSWLMAAAVLRVGLYPFHQWLPVELGKEADRAVILFIVPTISGLALWARMALVGALPENSIVLGLSVLSVLMGGLLAWRSEQARQGLPFIALGLSGFVGMLAAFNPQPAALAAATLTAATLNWMFVTFSLFVARGLNRRQPYWIVGALIAVLSLSALPGTLGFVVQGSVIQAALADEQWLSLLAVAIAQALLVASALRLMLSDIGEGAPGPWLRKALWIGALVCGAFPLIGFALAPNLIPALPPASELIKEFSLIGWVLLGAALALGGLLAWRGPFFQRGVATSRQAFVGRVLRLEWLNYALFYVIDRLTGLLRAASSVLEGEGGLLWTVILIVIVVVLYTGAL